PQARGTEAVGWAARSPTRRVRRRLRRRSPRSAWRSSSSAQRCRWVAFIPNQRVGEVPPIHYLWVMHSAERGNQPARGSDAPGWRSAWGCGRGPAARWPRMALEKTEARFLDENGLLSPPAGGEKALKPTPDLLVGSSQCCANPSPGWDRKLLIRFPGERCVVAPGPPGPYVPKSYRATGSAYRLAKSLD